MGDTECKTETIKNGGKNPRWAQTFEFPVKMAKETLKIEVFDDQGSGKTALLGVRELPACAFTERPQRNKWFALNYSYENFNKAAGVIHLKSQFKVEKKFMTRSMKGPLPPELDAQSGPNQQGYG